MSAAEVAAAIGHVVRYAALHADRVRAWTNALLKNDDDPNVMLGAMADELEENGDWRHVVIRNSLERKPRQFRSGVPDTPTRTRQSTGRPYAFDVNGAHYRSPVSPPEHPDTRIFPTFGEARAGEVRTNHADGTSTKISLFPGHDAEVRWYFPHTLAFPKSRNREDSHQLVLRMPVDQFREHVLPLLPDAHAAAVSTVLSQTHPADAG